MIEDAKAGKIQYILAKSISRFARNTVDVLTYVRELKECGVSVFFEKEKLETAIEHQMTRFLLELGSGWAFVGRQKELVIAGKTRRLDLLFYHIHYRFYLVIELKVKPFEPEFAGKLNFYVNAVNDLIRTENDNPTIGLLVCRDMERTEVQYALQGIETPIGVATYSNVKIEEIQAQLPTVDQINACIERAEEELSRGNEH